MSKNDWLIKVDDLAKDGEEAQMAEAENDRWQRQSIYKLPACVISLNKKAYTPQAVSFGPYHYKNQTLMPMEEHKERAVVHFLKRSKLSIRLCLDTLREIVDELMAAYDSLDASFQKDKDAFLEIMIRDGCFMLEILRARQGTFEGYAANDPIFSEHGKLYVIPHIKRDMLMLENQLPMKVLHRLYKLQHGLATENESNKLAFEFFFGKSELEVPSDSLHILDMYRKTILQFPLGKDPVQAGQTKKNGIAKTNCIQALQRGKGEKRETGDDIIRSAVELDEAGIKIKRSKSKSLRGITFKNGELRLPTIIVDDTTEPLFLNLIAYERFHVGAGNEVTAYVFFMDNIIDDAPDVRLLHSKDIIQNGIGSDKAAAKLFNSLSKDISLDKTSPLGEVYRNVNAYCKRKIPKYRAVLYHTYLTSPWAIISVLAAVFLFALTITQTIYSILPYYNQK